MRPTALLIAGCLALVLSVPLAALSLSGGPAVANHVAGATYEGFHNGGGDVEFTLTQDGSGLMIFTARDVPGDTCDFGEVTIEFFQPLPIVGHSFDHDVTIGLSIDGNFPTPGTAQGTLRMRQQAIPPFIPACDSGVIGWNADTGAPPPPTPTPSPTPSPEPTPTPTDSPVELTQGDADCDGDVDAVDALQTLRYVAGLGANQQPGCPALGGAVPAGEAAAIFGDVDCDGDVDAVDALQILRFVAGLPVNQNQGCTLIGAALILTT